MPAESALSVGRSQVVLVKGDITKIPADAIANAANSALAGGGGVDGAIHRAGGPTIMRELDAIRKEQGGCATGNAVATSAGQLPAQFVFHTVGPVYRDGEHHEADLLASCYSKCLDLAAELSIQTISFPSISTGVYGYPMNEAAQIAIRTVVRWLASHKHSVRLVKLVQFSEGDHQTYRRVAAQVYEAERAWRPDIN